MGNVAHLLATASVTAMVVSALIFSNAVAAAGMSSIEQGKAIAFNNQKGNCLACHYIEGGDLPGNIGPALTSIKERFSSKEQLRAQIFDARVNNPETFMPPFGRHKILSDDELNKVVDFIYSL